MSPYFRSEFCFVGYEELQKQRKSEAHDNNAEEITAQASFGKNWKDFPKSFLLLVGTISYAGLSIFFK